MGFPISRYRYDKYSAADKLLCAYFMEASRKGIACYAEAESEAISNAKESVYFYLNSRFASGSIFFSSAMISGIFVSMTSSNSACRY